MGRLDIRSGARPITPGGNPLLDDTNCRLVADHDLVGAWVFPRSAIGDLAGEGVPGPGFHLDPSAVLQSLQPAHPHRAHPSSPPSLRPASGEGNRDRIRP